MRESRAPVGTIQRVVISGAREEQVPAHGAEYFDGGAAGHVALTDWEHLLAIAIHSWTTAKGTIGVLGKHSMHPASGEDEPRVDQTV